LPKVQHGPLSVVYSWHTIPSPIFVLQSSRLYLAQSTDYA
jgi:hypothetical protein